MALDKFLRSTIFLGLFAVPFTVLFVPSEMFFPFISGKNFAFRIIVEIIFAAWLLLAYRDAAYRPKKEWMLYALTGLIAILALADFFGANPYRSFWSNYERMEGLVGHLHLFAFFVVMSTMLAAERLWDRFFHTSLGVSVLVGIYGLFQLAGKAEIHQGGVRLDATLGNAIYLAVYMLFHIFLAALFLAREGTSKGARFVYGAIMLLDLFILYHTATRGAILGLLGGAVLASLLIIVQQRDNARLRKFAALGIVATLVLVGGIFVGRNSEFVRESPVLSRFITLPPSMVELAKGIISGDCSAEMETTIRSRCLVWRMSLQGALEQPLLGYGQENYIQVFNKHYNPSMYAQEPWFDRSHNVFFDWLIAGGIFALLLYLSLFSIALYYLFRRGNTFSNIERAILTGLLAGYFFQNLSVFDNLLSYILFYSILAYVAFRGATKGSEPLLLARPGNRSFFAVYSGLVAVLLLLSLYFANLKPIFASTTLIEALKPQESLDKNLQLFEDAIGYGTFGSGEAREQLYQGAVRIRSMNVPAETKQKFYDVTLREGARQIEENPGDARYELFHASFLRAYGQHDEALAHLERARALSPKKQAILFELGTTLIAKGDYRGALEVFKEAYELEPAFSQARLLYAVAALYAREDKVANEHLMALYGTTLPADDRVLSAYIARGENSKAITILENRLATDPTNVQYRIALAELYLKLGNRTRAIAELRRLIADHPEYKTEAEAFIVQIERGEI